MSTTNTLDLNNRIDALEKISHNVEPIQQQIDELKAWTDSGTKDASGNPIILTDGAAFNAVDLKVSLEPIQSGSGTPSPENVRPITGYTECVVTVKDEDETTQATATITFGQTVYGGTVNFKTGKVTVDRVLKVFTGGNDENWHGNASWNNHSFVLENALSDAVSVSGYATVADITSNLGRAEAPGNLVTAALVVKHGVGQGDGRSLYVNISDDLDTATKFKNYIASNPLQICYKLATPIILQLTPAELELIKGYNYITTNGTTIDLTYQPDNLKADIMLTVSQLYGSKISIFDGILTGGDTGQVLTKTSDDNYDATWATLPATRTTTKKK